MRRSSLLLGIVSCAFLSGPSDAGASVYWSGKVDHVAIGRANDSGAGIQREFIKLDRYPVGIAVGGGGVYWSHATRCWPGREDSIGSAGLDGTAVSEGLITGIRLECPGALAVTDSNIYWASATGNDADGAVGRANLDGSEANPTSIHPSIDLGGVGGSPCDNSIESLAAGDAYLYWVQDCGTNRQAIVRAPLAGPGDQESIVPVDHAPQIAVDANHLYWTRPGGIGRSELDGTGLELEFMQFKGGADAVAVNSDHIYWTDNKGRINRADIDGTHLKLGFVEDVYAFGLAADDRSYLASGVLGSATAKGTQAQRGSKIRVTVRVRAARELTASVTGKVKAGPTLKLKPTRKQIAAGTSTKLRVRPRGKRKERQIARALKNGKRVVAKLIIKLADDAGNTKTVKLSVRLKRAVAQRWSPPLSANRDPRGTGRTTRGDR